MSFVLYIVNFLRSLWSGWAIALIKKYFDTKYAKISTPVVPIEVITFCRGFSDFSLLKICPTVSRYFSVINFGLSNERNLHGGFGVIHLKKTLFKENCQSVPFNHSNTPVIWVLSGSGEHKNCTATKYGNELERSSGQGVLHRWCLLLNILY